MIHCFINDSKILGLTIFEICVADINEPTDSSEDCERLSEGIIGAITCACIICLLIVCSVTIFIVCWVCRGWGKVRKLGPLIKYQGQLWEQRQEETDPERRDEIEGRISRVEDRIERVADDGIMEPLRDFVDMNGSPKHQYDSVVEPK